jgi:hypothetical protein
MRVTLIGHATILVELDGANVLMDPVFGDPFEDGAVEACPSRQVFVDKLPKIDKVIISHAHLDHFDVPSLDKLSRDIEFFCPEDAIIPHVLHELGFKKVRTLEAGTNVSVGNGEILTTFSNIDVVEFGVVFKDKSGVFWNEVDTVVTRSTIEFVKMQMGEIDLLFSVFACQNLTFFGSMRAGYPLDISKRNLANVRQIAPKLCVPGSAGFRFTGALAWTNPFVFPISRSHFLADLARVAPEVPSAIGNPGDVFEIANHAVKHSPGASPISRMIEDDTHLIDFDATAPIPPLEDPNLVGYPLDVIERQVEETLTGMIDFIRATHANGIRDSLLEDCKRAGVSHGIVVLFPDGRERWVRVDFGADEPTITRGEGPLHGVTTLHRIAASILAARARYEKSYVYYRGFSRFTHMQLGTEVRGNVVTQSKELPDVLSYYLASKAPGADRASFKRLDMQLQKHFEHQRAQ